MEWSSPNADTAHHQTLKQQGLVLLRKNRIKEAMTLLEQACRADTEDAESWYLLSSVYGMAGYLDKAGNCCRRVIALQPDHSFAYSNLGNIFYLRGYLDQAVREYRSALRTDPDNAAAHANLANALGKLGCIDVAIVHYQECIRLDAGIHEAHSNLGNLLLYHRNRLDDALACYRHALRLRPDFVPALLGVGNVYGLQGRHDDALASYREALTYDPRNATAHSNLLFSLCYRSDCDAAAIAAEHVRWGDIHGRDPDSLPPHANVPEEEKRLRIGYVSADFRSHPVGIFMEQVLAHHDKSRVEIFCYSNHALVDDLTRRLRRHADHWRDIFTLSEEAFAERVRRDGIDILVDLSGHTAGNRLLTFALKPAPVQVTWMSYVATTGLKAMDYILGNRYVIPPQDEQYYVEQVVRLPHSFLCFTPPQSPIEVSDPPALSGKGITFGCFNNTAKLTPEVVATWSRLLLSVPGSRLFLKSGGFNEERTRLQYRDLFAEHGVGPARLTFARRSPRDQYLAAYREVDIALDPFPYNGGTTTMEALWMGVPVVTLRAERFVSRMGESIMMNAGLEECVTHSKEAYIAKAAALACDLPSLAELRRGLRDRLVNSPLCDGPGFTADLERAYRGMWEAWCHSGRSPTVQ